MKISRLQVTASSILVFLTLVACAFTAPSGSKSGVPTVAVATVALPTALLPTFVPPTSALPTPLPAAPTLAPASGGCVNAYYPVSLGASWSYSSTGGNKGDYTYTRTIPDVTDTGFSTSDQYSNGVTWVAKWNCNKGNMAALDAGPGSATLTGSKYKLTSDSITADGYNIPASFDKGTTWSEKVTINGSVTGSAGKVANSQIFADLNCTAGGAEKTTVPAGTFDTVIATCTKNVIVSSIVQGKTTQLASNLENITFWYAKSVGDVKSVATGGSNNETIVLTQYKIP